MQTPSVYSRFSSCASSQAGPSRRILRTRTGLRHLASEARGDEQSVDAEPSPYQPRILPYELNASIILSRTPLLTSKPTAFESAYYAYQSRLHRALSTPIAKPFYFKKGTILDRRFAAEERQREYETFGAGWEPDQDAEKLEDIPSGEDEIVLVERSHAADKSGDVKSLNRAGERTLYLLVKHQANKAWAFPSWKAGLHQPLHQTVKDGLVQSFGPNMNTWVVGRQPVAVHNDYSGDQLRERAKGSALDRKTFYFRGRILAGKPQLGASEYADTAWLTKDEIRERVAEQYWDSIRELIPKV